MDVAAFLDDPRVRSGLDDLESTWNRKCERHENAIRSAGRTGGVVSDIVDGNDHEYVDLVLEGGGVLGIALVGYTTALEHVGIRFRGIAGTSAGAINALLTAASGTPGEAKHPKLIDKLANVDMMRFVDGGSSARRFCRALARNTGTAGLAGRALPILDDLIIHLGINPGDRFLQWIKDCLADWDIREYHQLAKRQNTFPGGMMNLRTGDDVKPDELPGRLAIFATDLTTETKVEFPKLSKLYFDDPVTVNPAHFVRASMSVPAFFHPYQLNVPARPAKEWKDAVDYTGPVPTSVMFVDGGVMSNFPINTFHVPKVPCMPTFGVKLGLDRSQLQKTDTLPTFIGAMFSAAMHGADFDFLYRNPDYRHLIGRIDTGEHHWLDFFLTEDAKIDLFVRGIRAATGFLERFDWENYRKIRADLQDAYATLARETQRHGSGVGTV